MKSLEYLRAKRAEILTLASRHGVVRIRVFGSIARGEPNTHSDIDFLVTFEPARSLLDQIGLLQDLSDLLGTRVDVVSEGGLSPYMREDILKEAIDL